MLMAPHTVLVPGMMLMLIVLSVNRLGDELQDWLGLR